MIGLVLRSRAACSLLVLAAVLGGFFVWHKVDRTSAVHRAVAEYVARSELTAIRVELDELKRRKVVSDSAKRELQTEIEMANALAEAAVEELEQYVSTVETNCVVDADLVKRLRDR